MKSEASRILPFVTLQILAQLCLMPESYFDMVRPGVLFYGVYPARDIERTIEVKPALTWKSKVVFSKVTQPGRAVSYGSLWHAEAESQNRHRPVRICRRVFPSHDESITGYHQWQILSAGWAHLHGSIYGECWRG